MTTKKLSRPNRPILEGDRVDKKCVEFCMEGYERLAIAVVKRAVLDYRSALRRLYKKPFDQRARHTMDDCERFFRNEIGMYTAIDGETIMRIVKERVYGEMAR